MNMREIRETNRHNRDFIAGINEKMGSDWRLTYSNKKVDLGFGVSIRKYAVLIGHKNYFYQPIKLPLMLLDESPRLDSETFKKRVDSVCIETKNSIYRNFKDEYCKIYEVEKSAATLYASLAKKDESSEQKRKLKI